MAPASSIFISQGYLELFMKNDQRVVIGLVWSRPKSKVIYVNYMFPSKILQSKNQINFKFIGCYQKVFKFKLLMNFEPLKIPKL